MKQLGVFSRVLFLFAIFLLFISCNQPIGGTDNGKNNYDTTKNDRIKNVVIVDQSSNKLYEMSYENDKIVNEKSFSNGSVVSEKSYTYNSDAKLISKTVLSKNNSIVYSYDYDSLGRLNSISKVNSRSGDTEKTNYNYDEENKIVSSTSDGVTKVKKEVFSYSEDGLLIDVTKEFKDDSVLVYDYNYGEYNEYYFYAKGETEIAQENEKLSQYFEKLNDPTDKSITRSNNIENDEDIEEYQKNMQSEIDKKLGRTTRNSSATANYEEPEGYLRGITMILTPGVLNLSEDKALISQLQNSSRGTMFRSALSLKEGDVYIDEETQLSGKIIKKSVDSRSIVLTTVKPEDYEVMRYIYIPKQNIDFTKISRERMMLGTGVSFLDDNSTDRSLSISPQLTFGLTLSFPYKGFPSVTVTSGMPAAVDWELEDAVINQDVNLAIPKPGDANFKDYFLNKTRGVSSNGEQTRGFEAGVDISGGIALKIAEISGGIVWPSFIPLKLRGGFNLKVVPQLNVDVSVQGNVGYSWDLPKATLVTVPLDCGFLLGLVNTNIIWKSTIGAGLYGKVGVAAEMTVDASMGLVYAADITYSTITYYVPIWKKKWGFLWYISRWEARYASIPTGISGIRKEVGYLKFDNFKPGVGLSAEVGIQASFQTGPAWSTGVSAWGMASAGTIDVFLGGYVDGNVGLCAEFKPKTFDIPNKKIVFATEVAGKGNVTAGAFIGLYYNIAEAFEGLLFTYKKPYFIFNFPVGPPIYSGDMTITW
ncbi:MAG TPA: hypothetical protein PK771_10590 [Spirochaetota bacterium]|nr:hypothetical protein [Spirochaetota bacterium]